VDGALLVPGEDQFDGPSDEGVEDRDGGSSGKAEDKLDPFLNEDVDQGVGSRFGGFSHRFLLKNTDKKDKNSKVTFNTIKKLKIVNQVLK